MSGTVQRNEVAENVWRMWPMPGEPGEYPGNYATIEIRRPEWPKASVIRPGEDPYLNVAGLMWRPAQDRGAA